MTGLGRPTRRWWSAAVAALGVAVGGTQWLAHRPDPAAADGVRVATVLLLTADARIDLPVADAGEMAERAALVMGTWDEAAQPARLAGLVPPDGVLPPPAGDGTGAVPAHFVATRWLRVEVSVHRADVLVSGHYDRLRAGVWRAEPDRVWRVELTRLDPVGIARGWRLVSR